MPYRPLLLLFAFSVSACGPIVEGPSSASGASEPEPEPGGDMAEMVPAQRAPMEGVLLHCDVPQGPACAAMIDALGMQPHDDWPQDFGDLGEYRDLAEDCEDPGLTEVLAVGASALGISPSNWHDNGGRLYDRDDLSQTSSGGGCTNCCWDDAEPALKAQIVERNGQRVIIVRVWELGADA